MNATKGIPATGGRKPSEPDSDDEDIFAGFGGLAEYRTRFAVPHSRYSNFIFDMPDVLILIVLSKLDFLAILRMRQTGRKGRAFIDESLARIYAVFRRQDPSLPPVGFLPLGAPDRDRRNLELFQDQFDPNRDCFTTEVVVTIEQTGCYEDWSVEAEMDTDGMGCYHVPGTLVTAVILKIGEEYHLNRSRDGIYHGPIFNLTVETDLRSLEEARSCIFPDWIRNITFVVGDYERRISFDVTEDDQVAELAPIADKVERAVRRLLRYQTRRGRQVVIKVAIAGYESLLRLNGFSAIAEKKMTVKKYRAKVERRVAAGGSDQWRGLLREFDSRFRDMVEHHGSPQINEDTKIWRIARLDDDPMGYGPSWGGASIVRKVRLA